MNSSVRKHTFRSLYQGINPYIPSSVKPVIVEATVQMRKMLGRADALPHFIIIGTQRGGSTSLYSYLMEHPNIAPAIHKEIHSFDRFYERGLNWYKAHFSSSNYLSANQLITGEASPYYILSRQAAVRLSQILPHIKLIALLRNPLNRAFSHHNFQVQRGHENLSFEDAVKREIQAHRQHTNLDYHQFLESYDRIAYLSRCLYSAQLGTWFDYFPREQLLILKSEDLYEDTVNTYKQVLQFLGLPEWEPESFPAYEQMRYAPMTLEVRKLLINMRISS